MVTVVNRCDEDISIAFRNSAIRQSGTLDSANWTVTNNP
jgi:hypothetical protein